MFEFHGATEDYRISRVEQFEYMIDNKNKVIVVVRLFRVDCKVNVTMEQMSRVGVNNNITNVHVTHSKNDKRRFLP